ncbi:MAG: hypothetical protein ACJA1C_001174 [Crocinitomicaceae bacterium]|jgi:hypothetical protein
MKKRDIVIFLTGCFCTIGFLSLMAFSGETKGQSQADNYALSWRETNGKVKLHLERYPKGFDLSKNKQALYSFDAKGDLMSNGKGTIYLIVKD